MSGIVACQSNDRLLIYPFRSALRGRRSASVFSGFEKSREHLKVTIINIFNDNAAHWCVFEWLINVRRKNAYVHQLGQVQDALMETNEMNQNTAEFNLLMILFLR